ncbi:hypothetical protein HW555_007593 [Spodoptera exigua]|uniref:Putative ionotropic receptor ligand binding domain-containing protein n=1 Tax=Spodoptera exigua TaxID=7107 RepID=A0A835L3H6_SPOEX|nr:hypothetical protein HW555_007593 [Spodoptera exigua]
MEPTWNPTARFLITISALKEEELRKVFDVLLKRHVVNVLVINGTEDAHLYTYNPYDNFACGKYYKDIISYGVCLQATNNLYPNKLVTGLRNCTLIATVPQRPPYSEDPSRMPAGAPKTLGVEQHLFIEFGKTEGFNVIFNYEYENDVYSKIASNMKVTGTMSKLQNNKTDAIFGSIPMTSRRSDAFECLYGHLDFHDDLRFFVKSASYVPNWKYVYLEFSPLVWCLLLLVFLSYSTIVILMHPTEDKVDCMLNLLRALFLNSLKMPDRVSVKLLTFVDMNSDDDNILQVIHSSAITPVVARDATTKSLFRHQGYLISAKTAAEFTALFQNLLKDPTWNPYALFLIVVRSLKAEELKKVFDVLLKTHVINVQVMNYTDDPHLYTYNPYDNFACGKYYKDIISYGVCLQATDLYPNKLVTGLRNCTLRTTVPHRIPFAIDPSQPDVDKRLKLGIEQYLFKLIGETEYFKVNFSYNVENVFSPINSNMEASGPMAMLQNNETDVMLGCCVLSEVRADAFTYLNGHLDYHDDFTFCSKECTLYTYMEICLFRIQSYSMEHTIVSIPVVFHNSDLPAPC